MTADRLRCLALATLLLLSAPAWAAEPPEASPPKEPQAQQQQAQGFLSRFRLRRTTIYERSHDTVKEAFREVSSRQKLSTVQVLTDGKVAALGAVVDARGFVLTKASELEDAKEVVCLLSDHRRFPASTVGVSEGHDLAMLKIAADKLTPVQWVEDAQLAVGAWLVTPGLQDLPLSIGVVSAEPRRIGDPAMGVMLGPTPDGGGPTVSGILPSSGAEDAGLKMGDVILELDGVEVQNRDDLIDRIGQHLPLDKVKVKVLRRDKELELEVQLREKQRMLGPGRNRRIRFQQQLGGDLSDRRSSFPLAIQHDTVLKPTECGGPLCNLDGKVVGLNIARAGRVSSFALPAAEVRQLLPDLMSGALASPEALKQLARRTLELKQAAEEWTTKLAEYQKQATTLQAVIKQADPQAKEEPEEVRSARSSLSMVQQLVQKAQAELGRINNELAQLNGQFVTKEEQE